MSFERTLIQSYNAAHVALVTGRPRAQILIREPVLQGLKNDLKNSQATINKLTATIAVLEAESAILRTELKTYKEKIKKISFPAGESYPQKIVIRSEHHMGTQQPTIEQIVEFVSINECISRNDLFSARRKENICIARRVIYHLCKVLTSNSFPEIGRRLNGRDHTTILHGYHRMQEMRKRDKYLDAKLKWYESSLTGGKIGETV